MGPSGAFLGILFFSGALARGRLQCYTCSFAKPCDPVLTECQEDEVCGISVGTSDQEDEVIERKGCLPRTQCPLLGRATYWSQPYALRHKCCEQDLCNTAASQRLPSHLHATLLLLGAIFAWAAHIFI